MAAMATAAMAAAPIRQNSDGASGDGQVQEVASGSSTGSDAGDSSETLASQTATEDANDEPSASQAAASESSDAGSAGSTELAQDADINGDGKVSVLEQKRSERKAVKKEDRKNDKNNGEQQ